MMNKIVITGGAVTAERVGPSIACQRAPDYSFDKMYFGSEHLGEHPNLKIVAGDIKIQTLWTRFSGHDRFCLWCISTTPVSN